MMDRPLVHELPPSPQQRLRTRRKGAGWRQYEGWLSPEALAVVEREHRQGEPLNECICRLLVGVPSVPSELPRVPSLVEDIRALVREELTAVTREADTPPVTVPSDIPSDRQRSPQEYVERKASLLARIQSFRTEGLSFGAIEARFNAEGIPPLRGKKWSKGTIGNWAKEAERSKPEEA
jgi:hypothetical protein